jgi:CheY-like chemotaxis protein
MACILIIDDDNRVLFTYSRILEQAGHEVVIANDGIGGIGTFKDKLPDLVITDIFMPMKGGLETIKELKRYCPDVKVIAISGGGGDGMRPENYLKTAKQLGAMCALTKPIEGEDLLKAVQECLS